MSGDEICPRCGTKFEVDNYCENNHARPGPTWPVRKFDNKMTDKTYVVPIDVAPIEVKPAPATVEWPEGADFTPWDMSSRDALMRLSPLHNAALVAREQYHAARNNEIYKAWERTEKQLRDQLAALKTVSWCSVHEPQVGDLLNDCPACECVHLSDQLAVATKALDTLHGAALRNELTDAYAEAVINTARAKIGEGKK